MKKKGNNNTEIAEALGISSKTVRRVLDEPTINEYKRPRRKSLVDPYEDNIRQWMQENIPVSVILERVRKYSEMPYEGGRTVFYDRVGSICRGTKTTNQKAIWRIIRRKEAGNRWQFSTGFLDEKGYFTNGFYTFRLPA